MRRFWCLGICILLSGSVDAAEKLQYQFKGIEGDILKNVQARLEVDRAAFGDHLSAGNIQQIYQQSPEQIKQAIKPYGYLHPVVHANLVHRPDTWIAQYRIELGVPLIITETNIQLSGEGAHDKALLKAIQQFPLKKGDKFNTEIYNSAKENLFTVANNHGYVKASLEKNQILIDENTNKVRIILEFKTGPRYYFGEIHFKNKAYQPEFLNRFIKVREDQAFSSQKLIKIQQEMEGSPYFQQVNVTPDFQSADINHRVPLNIEAVAPKSQKYNIGIGYGTYTHTRLSAGVSLRHLTDTGHHFDAQMRLSSVISSLSAKYFIPGKDPLKDQWVMGTDVKLFTPKNVFSKSTTLFGGYETEWQKIKSSLYLNYLVERYRIGLAPKTTSEILYPRLNLYYVKADDLINPTYGTSLNLSLLGSQQELLSSTSFAQGELRGKFIFSPLDFSRVVLKADLGYTVVHDMSNLPASLRFYAGESNGLRGYPDSSVGPGRYLMIGSLEYQNKIWDQLYGAIFYDAGKSVNHINDPFSTSAGIGLIYHTIIGPIKLYGAHAINSKTYNNSFEFSIGPEF